MTHTVLQFDNAHNIPNSVRAVLAYYTVAKIQSTITGDVTILQELGIIVRGIVDSATLFMLVKPGPGKSLYRDFPAWTKD